MHRIVKEALPMERYIVSREAAIREMEERKESYKLELLLLGE